ncbi:MAG: hypothetical protein FWC42_09730 [Proteobacteria bacterium]|nr:hypothetical protein [Pseudomonadota bacterium]
MFSISSTARFVEKSRGCRQCIPVLISNHWDKPAQSMMSQLLGLKIRIRSRRSTTPISLEDDGLQRKWLDLRSPEEGFRSAMEIPPRYTRAERQQKEQQRNETRATL